MESTSNNNYIYYVIRDSNGKVLAHIIGAQHWVEPKDKKLNPLIIDAITHSSRAVLEMPPKSGFLPNESQPDFIIRNEIKHLKSRSDISKVIPDAEAQVITVLESIKGKTSNENYNKVLTALGGLNSGEEKLTFVKAINNYMFEFNLVSLEENLNTVFEENNNHTDILPLEDSNVPALLKELQDREAQKIQVNDTPQINEDRIVNLEKALYEAWRNGDAEKLSKILKELFDLIKEPPDIAKFHASRDVNMAKRIVGVVQDVQKEGKEATIVVGFGHLLYSNSERKNVMEYLNDHFKTDLIGCSITQIKMSDTK